MGVLVGMLFCGWVVWWRRCLGSAASISLREARMSKDHKPKPEIVKRGDIFVYVFPDPVKPTREQLIKQNRVFFWVGTTVLAGVGAFAVGVLIAFLFGG